MNKTLRILLGFLLVGGALGLATLMIKTKPKAERKPMSAMMPVVTVEDISPQTLPVTVEILGTVIPDVEVALRAEVSGTILSVYPDLIEGRFVKQGDLLFEMDARDYELNLLQAKASLQAAVSDLRLEEGQQAVAAHEITLLDEQMPVDDAYQDIMRREPQLLAAEAAVASAQSSLQAAELDLERVKVYAPFDAVVVGAEKDRGDYAQAGETLVELMATQRLFVRGSLPVGDLKFFPDLGLMDYPARLSMSDGNSLEGRVYNLLPKLSEQGRMAQVLIAVTDPYGESVSRPLFIDELVTAELSGIEMPNVYVLDRRSLRQGNTIWMLDEESKLRILPVEILQGYASQVMVRFDAPEKWQLVTSNVSAAVEGMLMQAVPSETEGGRS
ncbi:efflux RND transporter periplasmic adaptor subunit [Kiritimatiellota bacterium B12222]|nr:efflux RND transporter periplasmic adaptor subunit [Kiritimatiellota bacterium B12222]